MGEKVMKLRSEELLENEKKRTAYRIADLGHMPDVISSVIDSPVETVVEWLAEAGKLKKYIP